MFINWLLDNHQHQNPLLKTKIKKNKIKPNLLIKIQVGLSGNSF